MCPRTLNPKLELCPTPYSHFMVHLNHSPQDVKLWNVVWLPIILGTLLVLPYRNRHMHIIEQNR
jgi:hypothetical protein